MNSFIVLRRERFGFAINAPKDDGIAKRVEPDQTAPFGTV